MSLVLLEYGKPLPPGVTEAEVLRIHPSNTEEPMERTRATPRPATHLELTIKYTVPAEKANIGTIIQTLKEGGIESSEGEVILPEGKVELVRVKAVPAPE